MQANGAPFEAGNIPPRALNGGLYTGEPFQTGAPWANVPVIPSSDYMNHVNLRSANPPIQALFQFPGNTRPGNNTQTNPGHIPHPEGGNFTCIPCEKLKTATRPPCMCHKMAFISGNEVGGECQCDQLRIVNV